MTPKKYFPDVSSASWEHPADKAALANLAALPLARELLERFLELTNERSLMLFALANAARVSETQFTSINRLVREACEILDVRTVPEVFVSFDPSANSKSIGVGEPFIILSSGLLDLLDEEELTGIIGHEIGHCMSGHVTLKSLLWFVLNINDSIATPSPFMTSHAQAVFVSLREWDRKSELSADRAALLVVQDPNVLRSMLMKLTVGKRIGELSLHEFVRQIEEYDEGRDDIDSIHRLLNYMSETHPFPAKRLVELERWVKTGAYQRIVNGEYERCVRDRTRDFLSDFDEICALRRVAEINAGHASDRDNASITASIEEGKKCLNEFFKGLDF